MSRVRQQLRRAAQEFADKIYDALRADLVPAPALKPAPSAKAAPKKQQPAPPRRRARPPSDLASTYLERVLIYVTEHPGAQPKAIIKDTGIRRPAVFAALASACSMGALAKHGEHRHVTYAPAGFGAIDDATKPTSARSSKPKYRRSPIGAAAVVDDVVAWIAAHPGCGRADLVSAFRITLGVLRAALDVARDARRIRMDGTRRTARYFATDAERSAQRGSPTRGDDVTTHDS